MAGTSYTRQSTIADGNIITAALFNNEFNQLLNAFAYASSGTTGHSHDGSAGQGAAISKIGDQDFNNKVVISATNNRIEFYSEVSGSPVEQVRIQDGAIVPVTDSDVDLGTTSVRFKDAYIDSATVTGTVSAATVTSTGTTNIVTGVVTGDMTFTGAAYNAIWDTSTNTMRFADNAVMAVGDSSELKIYHDGSNSYIREAGTGNLFVTADTDIFMGSSNGAYSFAVNGTGGTTTREAGTTTLTVDSDGVSVPDNVKINLGNSDDLQIFHDGSNSRITDTGTGNLYLTGANNISLLSNATTYGVFGTSVDLYYSNSKKFETTSAGATVTGSLTASGAVNTTALLATTNIDTPQIEVTSLRARDGSVAGTIADSTGVITLNCSVLTTTDINGGTIDGTTIGGSTPAAGTFTTGTIATADINGGAVDGTTIGGSTPAAGTFTTGTIATADINGGAIDGTVIGGSTAAAGSFTSLTATGQVTVEGTTPSVLWNDNDGNEKNSIFHAGGIAYYTSNGTDDWNGRHRFRRDTNSGDPINIFETFADGDVTFYKANGTDALFHIDAVSPQVVVSGAGSSNTDPTFVVDRTGTADGVIMSLKAGGDTNANFYSTGGNRLILADNTGDGVKFTPTAIMPRTSTNGAYDNNMDLGLSSSRFRDAYIAGGVYLGGTAAANKFEDYEEGTWTPVYKGATSDPTYDADSHTAGRYTKIGRVVHAVGRIRTHPGTSPSQGSGQLGVSLPFTVMDDGSIDKQFGVLSIAETKGFLSNQFPYSGFASRNTQVAYINKRNEAEQQTLILNADSALDLTDDDKNDIVFSITYFTDA